MINSILFIMIKQIFSINNTLNLYYVIRFYFFVLIFIYLIHNPFFVRAMENLYKKRKSTRLTHVELPWYLLFIFFANVQ